MHRKIKIKNINFTWKTLSKNITKAQRQYLIFARQSYENPQEVTRRIVCDNCHLANKLMDILNLPKLCSPILYLKQFFEFIMICNWNKFLLMEKGGLNVGGVLILSEGFKLAAPDYISHELKENKEMSTMKLLLFYELYRYIYSNTWNTSDKSRNMS